MSLTEAASFECPYCMTINDIDIDIENDINQHQIVDCQICCQPIEVMITESPSGFVVIARRDDE